MDTKDGRDEGITTHLRSLLQVAGTNKSSTAAYRARDIVRNSARPMLMRLSEHPEQAKNMLPLAKEMFRVCAALAKHDSSLMSYGMPVIPMVYCIAGETDQLDKLIKSLPESEQKSYKSYLERYHFTSRMRNLTTPQWIAKENEANRRQLVKALFNSEWFCKEQIRHFAELSRLIDYGFVTVDDMSECLSEIPEKHSQRAELLCARASMLYRKKVKIEEADKAYAEAIEVSKLQKNEKLANLALAYRAIMFAEQGKLERAKEWGDQVKREQLNKNDLRKFDTLKKRWDTTAKEK